MSPVVSTPLSTKGQEYKDQIHNIFVKQGITDGIKTGVLMLMNRRYKACKLNVADIAMSLLIDSDIEIEFPMLVVVGEVPGSSCKITVRRTWEQCEPIVTEVFKLSKYFAATFQAPKETSQ